MILRLVEDAETLPASLQDADVALTPKAGDDGQRPLSCFADFWSLLEPLVGLSIGRLHLCFSKYWERKPAARFAFQLVRLVDQEPALRMTMTMTTILKEVQPTVVRGLTLQA